MFKSFKKVAMTLSLVALITVPSLAEDDACLSTTEISAKQVQEALAPLLGGAKVVKVSESPIDGLYEVIIEARGKKIPIYVDCELKYLISGEIIDIKNRKSLTREKVIALQKETIEENSKILAKVLGKAKVEKLKKVAPDFVAKAKIVKIANKPKPNLILGNPSAKTKVVIIEDPQCPACAMLHEEILKLLEKRKDIAFEVYLFPLKFHQYAKGISENIVCAKSQKEKQKILHESFEAALKNDKRKLKSLSKPCATAKPSIEKSIKFGKEIKISGTPTIIFPHNIMISGAMKAETLEKIIDILK